MNRGQYRWENRAKSYEKPSDSGCPEAQRLTAKDERPKTDYGKHRSDQQSKLT